MATWNLDPSTTHLNHGSFGATPVEVLTYQTELRSQLESNPVDFMLRRYQPRLEDARAALADFITADADGLVFVPNATYGVNSVLRSLEAQLTNGDEIIVTNHTYNACRNAAEITAQRTGATVVVAQIPFPIDDDAQAVQAFADAVSPSTAVVLIDHVTSATGIVMPVAEIAAALPDQALLIVDGAHAPGMLDVQVEALGADFYTANCHKWLCSPKGAAFLWVAAAHRDWVHAVAISHGMNGHWPASTSDFHARFDWTGTDDPTARLSVGRALEVMDADHVNGWSGVRQTNHQLLLAGRNIIAAAISTELPVPETMLGAIATLVVPEPWSTRWSARELADHLHTTWSIEVPVIDWSTDTQLVRISAQQYNRQSDYERLAEALQTKNMPG